MTTAFQSTAFQSTAFQIDAVEAPARGNAGSIFAPWVGPRSRTDDDVRRSRERFGITQRVAEVLEDVAAQAQEALADAEAAEAMLRELKLKRIKFRKQYLEMLTTRRAEILQEARQEQQRKNAMILMLIASAAVQ